MRDGKAERLERLFGRVLIVLALIAFFLLNRQTRLMRDDWSYALNFLTKEPIRSFGDIFESLGIHYQRVNGRLPVHFLAHIFLWLGRDVFDVVNTLGFAGLVTLIVYHAAGTLRPFRPWPWLLAFLALWFLTPAFGESFLWVTGASNYLWGTLLILLCLVPFRRLAETDAPSKRPLLCALLALPCGALAGWTNENTACAAAGMVVLFLLWRGLAEKKRLPLWCFAWLLGCLVGVGLMLFAPGELGRLDAAGGMTGLSGLFRQVLRVSYRFLRAFWPAALLWLALLIAYLRRPDRTFRRLAPSLIWLLGALAAAYAMILSPEVPDRVLTGPLVYLLVSLLSLLREAVEGREGRAWLRPVLGAIGAAAVVVSLVLTLPKLRTTAEAFDAREAEAAEQLAAGRRDLVLPAVYGSGSRFDAAEPDGDLDEDADHWLNIALQRYLGADSVTKR